MALEPHQQRVVDEKNELDTKRRALADFISSNPIFERLPLEERSRLTRQQMIMYLYSEVLGERINAFTKLIIALCALLSAPCATAQTVLVPCYEPSVGTLALASTPKGQAANLMLILNPNSGPGLTKDLPYATLAAQARVKKIQLAYYLDLIAWPGDGTHGNKTQRWKTVREIVAERSTYIRLYGTPDAWFLDDVQRTKECDQLITRFDTPLKVIANPGTAYTPPIPLPARWCIISHESAGLPPGKVTDAAISLRLAPTAFPTFLQRTASARYRYAHTLDDQWRRGQTAYNTLSPYFERLFPQ